MRTRFDLQVGITLLAEGGPKVELKLDLYLRSEGWAPLVKGQHQIVKFDFDEKGALFITFRNNARVPATDLYPAFVDHKVVVAEFQMSDLELYAFDTEEDGLEGIEGHRIESHQAENELDTATLRLRPLPLIKRPGAKRSFSLLRWTSTDRSFDGSFNSRRRKGHGQRFSPVRGL